jgi:polyphenol oxidase
MNQSPATNHATKDIVRVAALSALPGVRHGFFTRNGGASAGIYGSNNCAFGSDDDKALVARNRAACAARLGASTLVTVYQRHTSDVVTVDAPWPYDQNPVADALVTKQRGIALGILTADCTPVLLADESAGVIAAAHAGWRGAFEGVLANTVAAMTKLGAAPARIVAAVGPCIAQTSYEVGPEFVARFTAHESGYARYFTAPKANGHCHFDLPRFAADALRAAGVGTVIVDGSDTCAADDTFFSYRRATLRGEPDYGRQLSAISLAGN